jgi:Protein of unknown function (DUF2934)
MKHKSANKPAVLNLHVDGSASMEEQIARRAHKFWQQHGRTLGHDLAGGKFLLDARWFSENT